MTAFVFATCLPRSMPHLKRELARTRPDLRLAYSRPGLITMRTDDESDEIIARPDPKAIFARATGRSLGFADDPARAAELALELLGSQSRDKLRLHVFARDPKDPDLIADDPAPIAMWNDELRKRLGDRVHFAEPAELGDLVFDVVLPSPDLTDPVLVGWHIHDEWRGRGAGGVRRVALPDDVPSRAYVKLEEALAWSGMPLKTGDVVVEIGSSPGGAAMSLLRRGAEVVGIDPSFMDPRVMAWRSFRHLRILAERVRTRDLPPRVDWLLLDANVAPHRALVALRHHVGLRDSIRGMLLTLKLNDAGVIEDLPKLLADIAEIAGTDQLRATQLPSAHQEVVVWAKRGR